MMKALLPIALPTLLLVQPATAQEVGIRFAQMPIGTVLVTEDRGPTPRRTSEKYLGKRGEFHVTEIRRSTRDGSMALRSTTYYDAAGRKVRSDKARGFEKYSPFSCLYMLGRCTHGYEYPNPFKNDRQTRHDETFDNRLDGDFLIVSWRLIDGTTQEIPFELGPYNLRVSSDYRNRLGERRGHRLIEIVEP